jgi:hypothetical protein
MFGNKQQCVQSHAGFRQHVFAQQQWQQQQV